MNHSTVAKARHLQNTGLMLPRDLQETNEYTYSRKHIDKYIRKVITDSDELLARVQQGIALLKAWLAQSYYPSKDARLAQVAQMDLEELVTSIFVGTAYCQTPEFFASVTGQLTARLSLDDKRDSIQTIAEIVAILADTDVYHVGRESNNGSMLVQSAMELPGQLVDAIERSLYLPPMVCEPIEVRSNFESPYLTHNDSLILGRGNSHHEDICLDVINTQNQVALTLDVDFLDQVEELPTHALDTQQKVQLWDTFMKQSLEVYRLLIRQGNRFWLTNKVDKRGRLYAQGYHVTTQGSPYKKAMLEFAEPEVVQGVPV